MLQQFRDKNFTNHLFAHFVSRDYSFNKLMQYKTNLKCVFIIPLEYALPTLNE